MDRTCMIDLPLIIDNAFPPSCVEYLDEMHSQQHSIWTYVPQSSINELDYDVKGDYVVDDIGVITSLSDNTNTIVGVLWFLEAILKKKIAQVYKARMNYYLTTDKEGTIAVPHTDSSSQGKVYTAIFYLDDCPSGPTIIFDTKENGSLTELHVNTEIESVRNRLCVFDGKKYHSIKNPKTQRRVFAFIFTLEE